MPNPSVRAAAEGLPNTSRRNALAITGSGLIAALGALPMSTRPANPAPVVSAKIADCVGAYYAAAAISIEANDRAADANFAPDCPPMPMWKPATSRAALDIGHRVSLTSSEDAERHFDKLIEAHRCRDGHPYGLAWEPSMGAALQRGQNAYADRLEGYKAEALASLRAQESAYAPIVALEDEFDAAYSVAFAAFSALIEVPCHSLADVRAMAGALIHTADRVGCELNHDEMRKVMFSLLGEQEA